MVSTLLNLNQSEGAAAASFGVIAVLVLVILIAQKELASTGLSSRYRKLRTAVNIGILPLLMAFFMIVFFKILEALR